MKYRVFTEEEEEKAKAIRKAEDAAFRGDRWDDPDRWMGKLGEWAFAELYPQFTLNARDFVGLKFDFFTTTGKRLEVKTSSGNYPWRDWFSVCIDHDQYHQGTYDLLSFCYYHPEQKKLYIVGWNFFSQFEKHSSKEFYKFKEPVYNNNEDERKIVFYAKNKHGLYQWKSEVLRPIISSTSLN